MNMLFLFLLYLHQWPTMFCWLHNHNFESHFLDYYFILPKKQNVRPFTVLQRQKRLVPTVHIYFASALLTIDTVAIHYIYPRCRHHFAKILAPPFSITSCSPIYLSDYRNLKFSYQSSHSITQTILLYYNTSLAGLSKWHHFWSRSSCLLFSPQLS